MGAGRIEHSRVAGGAYRPLHETRRGKEDVVRARARARKHAPARTYYARTHARMPVHTHRGRTEEGHRMQAPEERERRGNGAASKNTKLNCGMYMHRRADESRGSGNCSGMATGR